MMIKISEKFLKFQEKEFLNRLKRILFIFLGLLFFLFLEKYRFLPESFYIIKYYLLLAIFWGILLIFLNLFFKDPKYDLNFYRFEFIGYSVFLSLFLVSSELAFYYFFAFSFLIFATSFKFCDIGPYFIATIGFLALTINLFSFNNFNFQNIFLYIFQVFALYFWAYFSNKIVRFLKEQKEQTEKIQKLYKKLKKNYQQLKELDKAKDSFIEITSHQIRTPLTLVEGTLSMILRTPEEKLKKDFYLSLVKKSYEGVLRLKTLVHNLLSVSNLDIGKINLHRSSVRIDFIAKEVYEAFKDKAYFKKIKFYFEKKGRFKPIFVDEEKIKEVMEIFVDNAFKYTIQGFIKIRIINDGSYYIFEVEDSGVGIPKKFQKQIFKKFVRADNVKQIVPEGNGLGLYIAQKLIKIHGGEVYFESVEGRGSIFGFRIPVNLK